MCDDNGGLPKINKRKAGGNWILFQDGIVYTRREGPLARLVFRSFDSDASQEQIWAELNDLLGRDPAPSISLDGSRFRFGCRDRNESDIMSVQGFWRRP